MHCSKLRDRMPSNARNFEPEPGGPTAPRPTPKKMSGAGSLKRLGCDVQTERTHNERIYLSVSWQRSDGAIARGNAEIHGLAWFKELGEKGHIKYPGHPLERAGKVVRGKQKSVHDGPYAEAKDIVNGFTLIEAEDLPHAVELSKGCPILEVGGCVEV